MEKNELVKKMLGLLQETLEEEGGAENLELNANSPLVGAEAIISSMGLVSFIVDVESMLTDNYELDLTLVSEDALSRSQSPFRCIDALADYVFELSMEPVLDDK